MVAKPKVAIYVKTDSVTALLVAKPRLAGKPLVGKPSGDCNYFLFPWEPSLSPVEAMLNIFFHATVILSMSAFLFSVPSAIHSHKPPLDEILSDLGLLKNRGKRLELFARYLMPNWTSFGNQVLKLQERQYFIE